MSERHRVFFALWPSEAVGREFYERGKALAATHTGRLMQCDTLHLTLAFLGEVSTEQLETLRVIGQALPLPACELAFDTIGRFARKSIVWVGCREVPPALVEHVHGLHARLREAGFSLDEREFVPHVTLLRNAAHKPVDMAEWPGSVTWPVREWRLVASRTDPVGAQYQAVESWVCESLSEP